MRAPGSAARQPPGRIPGWRWCFGVIHHRPPPGCSGFLRTINGAMPRPPYAPGARHHWPGQRLRERALPPAAWHIARPAGPVFAAAVARVRFSAALYRFRCLSLRWPRGSLLRYPGRARGSRAARTRAGWGALAARPAGALTPGRVNDRILGFQLGEAERVRCALQLLHRFRGDGPRDGVHRVRRLPDRAPCLLHWLGREQPPQDSHDVLPIPMR
jgi:hypothetical protein